MLLIFPQGFGRGMAVKLSVISFTEKGKALSEKIEAILETEKETNGLEIEAGLYTKCRACAGNDENSSVLFVEMSVGDWAKRQMEEKNAMLFIGACGIAVRAIGPFLTDKLRDAPVLVMDETCRYVIPIISGHMGGSNELAEYIGKKTGAEPVITTATDRNQKFAVDLFAKRNGLFIVNKDGIAKVSAKVLAGREITLSIEPGYGRDGTWQKNGREESGLPEGIRSVPYPPSGYTDIVITSKEDVFDTAILLKPKEYIIGMGCKKGKTAEEIADFIAEKMKELGISTIQVFALASVSRKRGEPGMVEWCRKERIPFLTYTAEELQEVEGDFRKSAFVKEQVGVDNVCERAALKACGFEGKLIAEKYAENGMTIAVAKREWKIWEWR